jgi:hypothetical protein
MSAAISCKKEIASLNSHLMQGYNAFGLGRCMLAAVLCCNKTLSCPQLHTGKLRDAVTASCRSLFIYLLL